MVPDGVGHPLTMTGFKLVNDDAGFDVWKDTTTLFTRVLEGHVPPSGARGDDRRGVSPPGSSLRARDFAKQLTTFRGDPAHRVDALGRFGGLFLGALWESFKPGGGKDD